MRYTNLLLTLTLTLSAWTTLMMMMTVRRQTVSRCPSAQRA